MGLSVVLAQERDGKEVILAYASRQRKESERKYANHSERMSGYFCRHQELSLLPLLTTTIYPHNGSLPVTMGKEKWNPRVN